MSRCTFNTAWLCIRVELAQLGWQAAQEPTRLSIRVELAQLRMLVGWRPAVGGGSHAAWLCTRTELAHLGIPAGWRPEEPRGSAAGNRTPVVRRLDVFLVLIVAIADY